MRKKSLCLNLLFMCDIDKEHTIMENSIEESNIYRNINSSESSEDSSTRQINQETTSEAIKQINDMETMENMDEESRDLADDKVTF
jgi:hypothetical protein